MIHEIGKLPAASLRNTGAHDPFDPVLPEGLPLSIAIDIRPAQGRIEVDLTDNPDCVPCGLNLSEASAMSGVLNGIFNCLEASIPHNSGSFRRVDVKFRTNCVIGGPEFPHSCSVSTTNVADRLVNMTQSAFAEIGAGYGVAEGGCGLGVGMAVISGRDPRRNRRYVNRLMVTTNGGPASNAADGWVSFAIPVIAGLMYRDSVEVDEFKYPIHIKCMRLIRGSGGAGKRRGSPAQEVIYGPRFDTLTAVIPCDGQVFPAKGILEGHDGSRGESWKISAEGDRIKLPNITTVTVEKGEWLHGLDASGGGCGDPLERAPELVLHDVNEFWETETRARDVYGVILLGNDASGYEIDAAGTERRRAELRRLRNPVQ